MPKLYISAVNKKINLKQKGDAPMRKITATKPSFFLNVLGGNEVVKAYHNKYNKIDQLLESNPHILELIHSDLKNYGDTQTRECPYSSEQILRMAIVKDMENWTYRDTIIRINESDFLRNFTRIGMGKIMSFGFLCGAINRVNTETWNEINGHLALYAIEKEMINGDSMRLDSTVCETNIHYPTDNALLWDSYRVVSRIIRNCNELAPELNMGYRFHDKKIKKLYTYIATHSGKKNKSTKRKIKQYMKILIERVGRICEISMHYSDHAQSCPQNSVLVFSQLAELKRILPLAKQVVDQSYRIHILGEKVPAAERIYSIFEEHTELFKRGKSGKPLEFGHLVTIGQTKEKFISYYDVRIKSQHDSVMKDEALQSHKELFGTLPDKFTADKNYYVSMDDIEELEKEMSICAIGKKGNRNEQEYDREHSEDFKTMQRFRAGVEGTISFLKRVFGMSRCINRGFKHFASTVARAILCHNIVVLSRA